MPGCHHAAATDPHRRSTMKSVGSNAAKSCGATLLTLSKNLAAYNTYAFARLDYVVALTSAADQALLMRIIEWDTGPPGAGSFAELFKLLLLG